MLLLLLPRSYLLLLLLLHPPKTVLEVQTREKLPSFLLLLLMFPLDRGQGVPPLTKWYPDLQPPALVEV